ncbi:MAG: hypothetical protein GY821_06145 [Gammaproteobacteria bacterium]|nr:hypothetical protein [Gammaproteobacteria bacterium]
MGGIALIAAILTYMISPYFNWITAIAGAGLLFSGLTHSRLLTRILQSLPYNKNR